MNKGLEVNVEIGLCTKEMAKENPIKDFEILIEEYKDKWSKQMYDYFKECLNEITKKLKAFEIIKEKDVGVAWFIYCCKKYDGSALFVYNNLENAKQLTQEEFNLLKEVLLRKRKLKI